MFMMTNHTAYGRLNQPHSVEITGYGLTMKKSASKTTLWDNVLTLMKARYGDENLTKLSKESKVGPGTMSRIKDQETSVGIDVLEKLSSVFRVEPWQLLADNLGVVQADAEKDNKQNTPQDYTDKGQAATKNVTEMAARRTTDSAENALRVLANFIRPLSNLAGKQMNDYTRLETTKAFLAELSTDTGIPVSQLIQVLRDGWKGQGTWAHPQVSTHLAQWLSPKFAVQVSKWVHEWLSGKSSRAKLPYHLERHMLNFHKIPAGYFSVLQEMTNRLVAPMEAHGYNLPEEMMPDISQAKMLCKHLRDKHGIDTSTLDKYTHTFPDGREVQANLYPVEYLGVFAVLMAEHWMPNKAVEYFKKRDPLALQALDKMLMLTSACKPRAIKAA